ncbi:cell division protein FtsQ/DivIB [Enterococcus faecalis]
MLTISKKKETVNKKKTRSPEQDETETTALTPWQKENQKYLKEKGVDPVWQAKNETEAIADSENKEQTEPTIETVPDEAEASDQNSTSSQPQKMLAYETFADRLPNIKKVRNKRLYRRLTFISSILLLAVLLMLYFVSPLSKLGGITVAGNQHIDSQTVIKQSKLVQGQDLWEQFFNRNQASKTIKKKVPRVKTASISLNGINTFKIKLTEYQVVASAAENGKYHPILENGTILPEVTKAAENGKPIFENFKDPKVVAALIKSYNELSNELKQGISEIKYAPSKANKELINLYMNDKNRVIINISQLSEKLKYYAQVAQQMKQPGVIDMEVGIFSYPYEQQSSQDTQTSTEGTIQEN